MINVKAFYKIEKLGWESLLYIATQHYTMNLFKLGSLRCLFSQQPNAGEKKMSSL